MSPSAQESSVISNVNKRKSLKLCTVFDAVLIKFPLGESVDILCGVWVAGRRSPAR